MKDYKLCEKLINSSVIRSISDLEIECYNVFLEYDNQRSFTLIDFLLYVLLIIGTTFLVVVPWVTGIAYIVADIQMQMRIYFREKAIKYIGLPQVVAEECIFENVEDNH